MRINPSALLMALLFAGPCLAQCPNPDACYDCGGGGDVVCCNGGTFCDCANGGDDACTGEGEVCVDGCCVVPDCPEGEAPCGPAGECDPGGCVNGCCVASCECPDYGCPCEPDDTCDAFCCPDGYTCDVGSGCCGPLSGGNQCEDGNTDCYGHKCEDGYCTSECIVGPCSGAEDCCAYDPFPGCELGEPGEYSCSRTGCCVADPKPPGTPCGSGCMSIGPDGLTCLSACTAPGTTCVNNSCTACEQPDAYGRCPYPSYVIVPSGNVNCCVQTHECGANEFCNVDSDCVGYGYSIYCSNGCCASCVAAPANSCGNCGWGQYQCDGSCVNENTACDCDMSNPNDPNCGCNEGANCGNCGTVNCQGNCDDPCPNQPGSSCGGCGTYGSDGSTCDDPCNGCSPETGNDCGSCGSTQCDGSCDDPCQCGYYTGWPCGSCGSTNCDGSCNDPCNGCYGSAGDSCGNCGSYDCNGNCDDPCQCDPNNGNGCGNCGTTNCDGSCDDPCQAVRHR